MTTDIIIVGAGLSGIGAACHLSKKNPEKTYKILEMRSELGGTWSLFKYPGIRSDSDMYTFGYSFKTWDAAKSYADAPSILSYLNEAAEEYKVKDKIIYNQKVIKADFNSTTATWTITTENQKTFIETQYTCQFLCSCSGYFSYEKGFTPQFKGIHDFSGKIIHPQQWPEDLDYKNKKVIVIGSGATAVTLVPAIAEDTEYVIMVQRSPTYVGALPNKDKIASFIKKVTPKKLAHKIIRFKNVTLDMIFFNLCLRFPEKMKKFIIKNAQKELEDFPVTPHFTPNYNPWEQRFCLAPDGDLFRVLREGKAFMETDTIEKFTEKGLLLKSGKHLEADIIITATGLRLVAFGGAKVSVDSKPFTIPDKLTYKGLMLNDLPNFFFFAGYTNASWTLKSDLTSEYASRIFKYLDKNDFKTFVPVLQEDDIERIRLLNLNSGYIHRAVNDFPKQGDKLPWKLHQNWFFDYYTLRIKSIKDNNIKFS